MEAVSLVARRSVSLAGLAAHLPEIWPAAELEPEHQGAVGHSVHIFALCQEEENSNVHQFSNCIKKYLEYTCCIFQFDLVENVKKGCQRTACLIAVWFDQS